MTNVSFKPAHSAGLGKDCRNGQMDFNIKDNNRCKKRISYYLLH